MLVSAFILTHLVIFALWSLPLPLSLVGGFREAVRPYLWWSGLFQQWDMFAPSPMTINGYVEADVVFRDGATRTWTFPRMEKLGLVDRLFRERYRKYVNDYMRTDEYAALWPDAARYVARANRQPANPPIAVVLYRYWSEIGPQPVPWMRYRFYVYAVKPGDLD